MPKKRRIRANGEGSYRVRGESVQFRWPGGTLTEKIGGRAAKELRGRLAEIASGPIQIDPNMTLSAWADTWYAALEEHVKADELEESTYEGYKYTKEIIKKVWPSDILTEINAEKIEKGLREVRKPMQIVDDAGNKTISWVSYDFRTVQKIKAMLGQIFKAAVKAGRIERLKNPMLDVDRLKNTERPQSRKAAYTNTEIAKLYRNLSDDRTGHLIRVCISCGFRGQEMLALGPTDIEPDGSMIVIDKAIKRGRKGRAYQGATKTPGSDRTVYVPAIAQPSAKFLRDHAEDNYILPNGEGGHIGWTCYRERYYKAVMDAGVIPIKPHKMRHTYTTLERVRLREADTLVMSNTGHSDIETMEGYTLIQDEEKRAAAERLDEFLRSIIENE
jgi:integrase